MATGCNNKLLSVKELARTLGVSNKTVYALCEKGGIPFYRVGTGRGTLRFELSEVKDALRPKDSEDKSRAWIMTRHLR